MKRRIDAGRLASELAGLPTLDRQKLLAKWRAVYGTEPPSRVRDNFLIRAIAYRMQEKALGGLKPATRRFLEKAAEVHTSSKQISTPAASAKPGTRLLREWHGRTYEVLVTENGVQCNGKCYRSLSEVARVITGVKWSGPLFFGLKNKQKAV